MLSPSTNERDVVLPLGVRNDTSVACSQVTLWHLWMNGSIKSGAKIGFGVNINAFEKIREFARTGEGGRGWCGGVGKTAYQRTRANADYLCDVGV